jgi:hypothetical protein
VRYIERIELDRVTQEEPMDAQQAEARQAELTRSARKDMASALIAGMSPIDAAAKVCHDWNTRGIEFGWDLDTRTAMLGWLMDLLADDLAAVAVQFIAAAS